MAQATPLDETKYQAEKKARTIRCVRDDGCQLIKPKTKCDADCLLCTHHQVSDDPANSDKSPEHDDKEDTKTWLDNTDIAP